MALVLLTGCFRVGNELEPKLSSAVQDKYFKALPSPFTPLSPHEASQDWGREERIGLGFARELDLYQALTSFKRASFLLPPSDRLLQLDYNILLCYYLGCKYPETLYTFETTPLCTTPSTFPPHQDLAVILYDSYLNLKKDDKADQMLHYLYTTYPTIGQKLALSKLLLAGDIPALEREASVHSDIATLLHNYSLQKKSTTTAQLLNTFLPGTGYLYLGQNQSAFTSFVLNGLFIWASCYFFQHGNTAAGIIFTSLEAGWYFGGIYGAGQEAKFYNEKIYEQLVTPLMHEKRYFPILMLSYGF